MQKIQIVSLAGSLLYIGMVSYCVWKAKLNEAYALLWLLFGVFFLSVSLWMPLLTFISALVGIVYPPATLFLIMLISVILILFQYSIVLSRRAEDVRNIVQEMSILEERLRKLEAEKAEREQGENP